MGFFDKLLKDGAEAAANVIAQVAITGEEIIVNAEKKRQDLGEAFEKRAERTIGKIARTHDDLAKAVDDHVKAFAGALNTAFDDIEAQRRAEETPAPQASVSEVTPEAVATSKPKLKTVKTGAQAPKTPAKPKSRPKARARTKKPTP